MMDNKEILLVADTVSNEKGVDREIIFRSDRSRARVRDPEESINRISRFASISIVKPVTTRLFVAGKLLNRVKTGVWKNPCGKLASKAAQIDQPEIELGDFVEGADRVGRIRSHRRADRQAGHRAKSTRGRASQGHRCLCRPRRQSRHGPGENASSVVTFMSISR